MFNVSLPSGREITFQPLSYRDRRHIIVIYDKNSGYTLEELLAASSIISVDGTPVETNMGIPPITYLDDFTMQDAQYFVEFWANINLLDEQMRAHAAQQAKKLMSQKMSTPPVAGGRKSQLKIETGN